jgi:hypothetical protein
MAFYLHRAFAGDPGIHALNDLRIVDAEQPEVDGRPGVAQIDHLIVHPWGLVIIESKSVHDQVTVRADGSGGDEWTRRMRGREHGFPSPIRQAERQAALLRQYLQRHREQLLGRMAVGLRTLSRLVKGTDQRGFTQMPIQIVVAISDGGTIRRSGGWTEPSTPFRSFVTKADLVADKIREEIGRHREGDRLLGEDRGDYGVWMMQPDEVAAVADFLAASSTPREDPPVAPGAAPAATVPAATSVPAGGFSPACSKCGSAALSAQWGRYGYYWKCGDCGQNTSMPTVCEACGAHGERGRVVRIRKAGPEYTRTCEACGIGQLVWREP